jgi:diaminopimelate dehydrogenase
MTRIAVIGYGNIGKGVYEAACASSDMTVSAIMEANKNITEQRDFPAHVPLVDDLDQLEADVAVLCTPTRATPDLAAQLLAKGICTVDSYDIHTSIYDVRQRLDPIAKQHNAVAIISAGWDPGSDSVIRALLEAMAPRGLTYTNFGPGMSMGHTVAAKSIPGVADALSVTMPLGAEVHRRMVYIKPMDGANQDEIKKLLLADSYFTKDDTHVIFTNDITAVTDKGHAVDINRKAASGTTDNQLFKYTMTINNPALTGQIMVSAARAAVRQQPGCYTLIEIPMIDLLAGEREGIIRRLV